jgi:ferritin-like metal-binding protein YciE
MAETTQTIATLHNLLDYDAGRFISAEIQLHQILPEWINHANSLKLKNILQRYLDFIEKHMQDIENFSEEENAGSMGLENRVMQAYVGEAKEKLSNCNDPRIKDACLLACIQAINHFKISMYGTAAAFANAIGMEKQAAIFHEAEVNEKQIDDRLSQLAEHEINMEAKTLIILPG